MTPAQQAIYTQTLIAEAGGDPAKVCLSYSTASKAWREVGCKIASDCRDQWIAPKLSTLHWDSTLMPSLHNKNITEERLTVVVGNVHELQVLGVPSYQLGTLSKIGRHYCRLGNWSAKVMAVCRSRHQFDIWHYSIQQRAYHTTCVTIHQRLNRVLLWSACQHHVGEIILSYVFTDLQIEVWPVSKSPDVTLFVQFQ